MNIIYYIVLFIALSPGFICNSLHTRYKVSAGVVILHAVIYAVILYLLKSYSEGYTSENEINKKLHTKVVVASHTGYGDIMNHIAAVTYLASIYDEVVLCIVKGQTAKVKPFFSHIPNLVLYEYSFDSTTHTIYTMVDNVRQDLEKFKPTHDIRVGGVFNAIQNKHASHTDIIPYNFYSDLGLDPRIYYTHNHINNVPESINLYNSVKHIPYIFISTATHTHGEPFSVEQVENHFNISRNTHLIICSDKNIYPENHSYYTIANAFVLKPFLDYVDTLIHASKIIVSDSSMFCLAMKLPIKTDECYHVVRNNMNYSYLWSPEYGFDKNFSELKVFKELKF